MDQRMVSLKQIFSFLFFVFLLIPYKSDANGRIRIIDTDDGGGSGQLPSSGTALNGCDLTLTFPLYLANLVTNPITGDLQLPVKVDDIYIHYTFGDETGVLPVNISSCFYFMDVNGEPVYSCHTTIITNLYSECHSTGDYIPYEWSFRNTLGDLYPLEVESDPGEIFSCNVFLETCFYCENECNVPPSDPEWEGEHWVECCTCNPHNECDGFPGPPQDTAKADGQEYRKTQEESSLAVQYTLAPNPFQSEFALQVNLPEVSTLDIQVFDATGKLVLERSESRITNEQALTIDTDDWPTGLYYLVVKSIFGSETLKALKIQ